MSSSPLSSPSSPSLSLSSNTSEAKEQGREDNNASGSDVSSTARTPVRSHGQRRMPVETAQMNVLGMDATHDHYLEGVVSTTESALSPSSSPKSSHWWQRVLLGGSTKSTSGTSTSNNSLRVLVQAAAAAADETSNDYSSLSNLDQPLTEHDPEDPQSLKPHASRSMRTTSTRTRTRTRSIMRTRSSSSTTSNTVEEQLKQDCSFFYQGMDDNMSNNNNNFTGPMAIRPIRPSAASLANFFSTREGDRYKAKYQQLNQTWIPQNNNNTTGILPHDDDLFLDEGVVVSSQQQDLVSPFPRQQHHTRDMSIGTISHSTTQKLSSLIFEQNGRLLMKLPRDQIKLIMDHDLEPGILSVEQWRLPPTDDVVDIVPSLRILEEDLKPDSLQKQQQQQQQRQQQQQPPPLRYVITVPDDLYRRVVAEMSYALIPPCWGFFKCCSSADGRADIRLALLILSVILILMFISTMVWPTE